MFKGNMTKMLKQAQEMQKQIEVNGKQEVLELTIDPDAMSEEKEMLEDLIISALNKALSKSQSDSQEKMNSVTGGMMSGLKLPGM